MKNSIPHVSTRGYYDLHTGRALKSGTGYFVRPPAYFESIKNPPKEITIVVHGMRNDRVGASAKFVIAQRRFKKLGYSMPVIGYSYDANVRGAHSAKTEGHATSVAQSIAKKNGRHLARLVSNVRKIWPKTRIRLVGHSLGSIVIASALQRLAQSGHKGIVESVHFFGASLTRKELLTPIMRKALRLVVQKRLVNYYHTGDEVLKHSVDSRQLVDPLGLCGVPVSTRPSGYVQRLVCPKNHRFASYAEVLSSFP